MTISDFLMIAAVLIAPFLAVYSQSLIEIKRKARDRKEHIFKVLMATRATTLDFEHVKALNLIDLEFVSSKPKEKKVLDSWKVLLNHYEACPDPSQKDSNYKLQLESWTSTGTDKLVDLLSAMAEVLGYDFDRVHLKKSIYYPKGHGDVENEQALLRRAALMFFMGDKTVKVSLEDKQDENNQS